MPNNNKDREMLILIIEKEDSIHSSVRSWAMQSSVIPVFVSSGVEALLWLGKGNIPDLILADASMEKMSGQEFVETIRSSGFFQDIPVVVFGYPEFHLSLASMRQAGACDHVFLPAEPEFLHERVFRNLKIRTSAQATHPGQGSGLVAP